MKPFLSLFAISIMIPLAACHSKKQQQQEFIPLGYYETRAEAQDFANSANADLAKTREQEKSEGVKDKDLPCGRYRIVTTRNSDGKEFWGAQMDATGCSGKPASPNFLSPQTGGKNP
ncbi:MAG TPA: hypothetical protein VGY31_14165 [Terriglobia bacterium]|nr:hypothetical protein [Terriglobia bacterium]